MPTDQPIVTFARAERLTNTPSGNPRVRLVAIGGASYLTEDDAQVSYQTVHVDVRYALTLSRNGKIIGLEALDSTDGKGVIY
jgi:hypothetical protein